MSVAPARLRTLELLADTAVRSKLGRPRTRSALDLSRMLLWLCLPSLMVSVLVICQAPGALMPMLELLVLGDAQVV